MKWEVVLVNKLTCVENKVDKRMGIVSSLVLSHTILVFLSTPSHVISHFSPTTPSFLFSFFSLILLSLFIFFIINL